MLKGLELLVVLLLSYFFADGVKLCWYNVCFSFWIYLFQHLLKA